MTEDDDGVEGRLPQKRNRVVVCLLIAMLTLMVLGSFWTRILLREAFDTTGRAGIIFGLLFPVKVSSGHLKWSLEEPALSLSDQQRRGLQYSGSAYTNSTGAEPWAGVVLSGKALYDVTPTRGNGAGTVFELALGSSSPTPTPLTTQVNQGALVLSWTNPAFFLQTAPTLTITFTNLPNAAISYTVLPSNLQMFFRLKAN